MDEKVLIKSERYGMRKFVIGMLIVGVLLSLVLYIVLGAKFSENYREYYLPHQKAGNCGYHYEMGIGYTYSGECWCCEYVGDGATEMGYVFNRLVANGEIWMSLIPVAAVALIAVVVFLWLHSYELTVTDKRVYGKAAWGRRVDLPVDSVSSIAFLKTWKGVSVATSSGRISFHVLKNASAIYDVLNNLLIERQQAKQNAAAPTVVQQSDSADQLKKYKDLLDSGVITQEEFDAKKAQLLGL